MKGPLSWVIPRTARQVVSFALMYVSYMCFYFVRKNYAFWLNELILKEGKRKEEVSVFGSVMESSYGIGKLIAGPIVDSTSPSVVLYGTLAVASICNVLMFQTDFLVVNAGLWALNGLVQSAAWPALAAIFMNWFEGSQNRGIWYSILSTNQNLGSALTPVLLTPLVEDYGWRSAVVGPGLVGLCFAVILFLFTQEYPDEHYELIRKDGEKKQSQNTDQKEKTAPNWKQTLIEMFTSLNLLSLGIGYAFLTIIRVGVQDWTLIILQETRDVPLTVARDSLVMLEVGGFLGGISAGAVSDRVFGGRRGPPMVIFTGLIGPTIAAMFWMPMDSNDAAFIFPALYFIFGFLSFGPHMLVGLTAREVFPAAPSTAGSFTKSLAQVGGTLAGYPLSVVVSNYGWSQIGTVWVWCAVCGALTFSPLLGLPAYKTKKD